MTGLHKHVVVAALKGGSASVSDFNDALQEAWREILQDPASKAQAAEILKIPEARLPSATPFDATARGAGFTGIELFLIGLATSFVSEVTWDLTKGVAEDAVKKVAKQFWQKMLKVRVEERMASDAFGEEAPPPDDVP